jgi:transposase-like protein
MGACSTSSAGKVDRGGDHGPEGVLKHLTKRLVERAMSAELADHVSHEQGEQPPIEQTNRCSGSSRKTLVSSQARCQS